LVTGQFGGGSVCGVHEKFQPIMQVSIRCQGYQAGRSLTQVKSEQNA